jgi:predicted dehydrogenase
VTRKAIELVKERSLGKPRLIQNIFSFNIAPDQWRLDKKLAGGGPLVDIGIYCLNAARYLTGEEPTEITASLTQDKNDERFRDVEDSVVFTLKFPSGCLAACSCSYANASGNRATAYLEKGTLEIDPAYGYSNITMKVKKREGDTTFGPSQANQFASELDHFSRCILDNTQPLTPGEEGMKDVRYIRAIYEAAEKGTTVRL